MKASEAASWKWIVIRDRQQRLPSVWSETPASYCVPCRKESATVPAFWNLLLCFIS